MLGTTGEVQVLAFLYACGLGFLLGAWYEVFRTVRLITPPTVARCFVQDIVFSISSAFATFFCFLALADGRMHPYLFFGELLGFFAFYCTIGRICHIFLLSVFRCIQRISNGVNRKVFTPFVAFLKVRIHLFGKKYINLRKKLQKKPKIIRFFSKKT